MTDKTKGFFNNQWVIAIGTGIIILIIPSIYDLIKSLPFLTSITKVLKVIGSLFLIEVKIYWFIIGLIVFFIFKGYIKVKKKPAIENPAFWEYKSDTLKELRWCWNWHFNGENSVIINLTPHCPDCDTVLKQSYDSWRYPIYECLRCTRIIECQDFEDSDDIEILILDNVRKKYGTNVTYK